MAEREEKQTVIVDKDAPRSSGAWIGVLIAVIVIVLLFLLFGGLNMFSGGGSTTTSPTNVQAPATNPGTGTGQ